MTLDALYFPTDSIASPPAPISSARAFQMHRTALLEALLSVFPLGVTLHAEDGTCLFANRAAVALGAAVSAEGGSAGCGAGDKAEPIDLEAALITETRVHTFSVDGSHYGLRTIQDVTEQRRVERDLFDRAFLDELTGLPNRALLQQSIEALIGNAGPSTAFAVAFIDLDNFKHINDYYSHAVGDALLVKFAERLSDMLGPTDLAGRIGGDEFLLLLTPVDDPERLHADIDAIVERIKQPFFIDGHEIPGSASIGVSVYPEHGQSYDKLRRNADNAMYRVKSGGKGNAIVFDRSMEQAATARMALEQRLRLAIRDRRFCCAVQPKVDIRSHDVVGVEILLRWRDEQGLIQAPGDFVDLAVELGIMDEISHLVLDETVRVIDSIDAAFGPNTSISLNVAAKQAQDVAFMGSFTDALAATGYAERFFIELTEEAFFAKSRFQRDVLPLLRRVGARISIDDFGVGYSSLSALADITADEIKIDRSFITEIHKRPRSQCILRAIESLGHGLGMSIIAEGVETVEELTYLQAATRIHHAQGYYFAKPLLLESLDGTVQSFSHRPKGFGRDPIVLRGSTARIIGKSTRC